MASISREGPGGERKRIVFRDAEGKQLTLRLGKCSQRAAESALVGVERLIEAKKLGTPVHADGLRWLEGLDDRLYARVAALGLAEPRTAPEAHTLGQLIERFEATTPVKQGTRTTYLQATRMLRQHFGDAKPLASITPADADAWRKAIGDATENGKTLARATVAKRVKVAKHVFAKAVRWGWIASSPLADLRVGAMSNPERAHYVSRETIDAALAACPDAQWRAIVGLCRFAGLRCPSELVGLRWADLHWERWRLTVRSPKTGGHEGHGVRVVPIAAELRPLLQDLFDQAEPGIDAMIPRLRDPSVNLRTGFERILARAGVAPWPRLFHNMRASCETDWVDRVPDHVVASWLGHSPQVARTHYLQTRDAHFDLVAGPAMGLEAESKRAAAIPAAQTRPHAPTGSNPKTTNPQNPLDLVGVGAGCDPVENWASDPDGVRTPVDFSKKTAILNSRGINSGSIQADSGVGNGSGAGPKATPGGGSAGQGGSVAHAPGVPTDARGKARADAPGGAPTRGPANSPASGPTIAPIASAIPTDPDLSMIASAWPTLPTAIKAGILAIVRASVG